MTLLQETHIGADTDSGFSLYFLATVPADSDRGPLPPKDSAEAKECIKRMFGPV
jgi:hypothetical protein